MDEANPYQRPGTYAAMAFGFFGLAAVAIVAGLTWKNRKEKVIKYAQPNFLFMLLAGLTLVTFGAILFSVEPSDATCAAIPWFVVLGSSLQILPLIVKVSAVRMHHDCL